MGWSCCQMTKSKRRAGKVGNRMKFFIYIYIYIYKFLIFKHWLGIFWLFPWEKKQLVANPALLRGWKNHLIPSCFNSKRKMNCRVGLGRKFGAAAAGEESQVFLEAWFCFEWNVGVPPFSLHVGGGSGTPRLVVSVLSAGWGQEWGQPPFSKTRFQSCHSWLKST